MDGALTTHHPTEKSPSEGQTATGEPVGIERDSKRVALDILLNKYVGGFPHLARAMNISRRGMLLHRLFEPHNQVESIGLQFRLPCSEIVITCAGRIVYVHPWMEAQGVEFTHIDPKHQRAIDEFLVTTLKWASPTTYA